MYNLHKKYSFILDFQIVKQSTFPSICLHTFKKTHYNKLHEMISLYLMGNEAANWTQWNTWEYSLWFENNLNLHHDTPQK